MECTLPYRERGCMGCSEPVCLLELPPLKHFSCEKCGDYESDEPECIQCVEEEEPECHCGNLEFGFNCVCAWVEQNPGTIDYNCEWCGLYTASKPQCNKCESE